MDASVEKRTIFISNLSSRLTEELIYELFMQAGPIEKCSIVEKGKLGRVAMLEYKHEESVPYAKDIFNGTILFGRELGLSTTNPFALPADYGPYGVRGPYVDHRGRGYDDRRSYNQFGHCDRLDRRRENHPYYGRHEDYRNHRNEHRSGYRR